MAKDEVLLKIQLEASKAKVDIKSLTKELEQMDKRTTEAKDKMLKLEMAELRLANANIKLKKHNNELNKSFTDLNKKLDGSTKATGAGASAALELGRVISDMPYGIRGVANNLSQFASNITFMATAADSATGKMVGLSGAIKGLWKSLMGPLGILLAIQAVIAALDSFSNQSKKADIDSKSLSNSWSEESARLFALKSILDDTNTSLESRNELVSKANKEFKDLNLQLDDNGNLTDTARTSLDNLTLSLIKNAKARAIVAAIQKEQNIQLEIQTKKTGESLAWYEVAWAALLFNTTGDLEWAMSKDLKNREKDISDSQKRVEKLMDMLKKGDADLAKMLFGGKETIRKKKTPKIEFLDSPEEFESKTLDLEGKMLSFQQRLAMIDVKDKEEALARDHDFQVKSLQLTIDTEKEKAEIRLQKYIEDINRKVESDKIDEYEAKEAIERARTTSKKEVEAIDTEYQPLFAILHNIFLAKKKALGGGEDDDSMRVEDYIATFKTAYSGLNDFLNSEFDRQMTIEQNKTNALNEELNNRLLNEQLSSQERKSIQNQIWQNDEALRKKQEQIAKKKFKTEKAFNISMAIVDTYAGATRALNDKTVPSTIARFALAGATITSGLLQVASIARQQFQSSSASTPIRTGTGGGAGGGVGDRSFNFTLAGQTEGNQLVDAIQSQFNNPIRAYVVSGDVTNQQQLDANIQSSASF